MTKNCVIKGCNQTATKRGTTCGPAHAQLLRGGITEDNTTRENEQHEQKGDSWSISLDATRIKTLEQLVEHCQIDLTLWEVERFVVNKWEVGAKDSSGEIKTSPLFQVKAWLKKNQIAAFAKLELEALKEDAKSWAPMIHVARPLAQRTGNMVEIDMMDVHFGKLAWHRETGFKSYDLPIAIAAFKEAFWGIVDRAIVYGVDKFLIPVGNDMFHIDNRSNTTTKGTQVDTDGRYHKIFRTVRLMLAEELEKLMSIAPVHAVGVPGNHDELSSWQLGESLECWFRHNKESFRIDNEPVLKKYVQHGQCMIGYWHGDKGKKSDFAIQMASDQPQMWAATKYREAHVGHIHQEQLIEIKGNKLRTFPSISGTDYWHAANHFDHNQRCGQGLVWNDSDGLISVANYTLKG